MSKQRIVAKPVPDPGGVELPVPKKRDRGFYRLIVHRFGSFANFLAIVEQEDAWKAPPDGGYAE